MSHTVELGASRRSIAQIIDIAVNGAAVRISPASRNSVEASFVLLNRLSRENAPIYGVNTGLGAAVDTSVSANDADVQRRIPLARSAGVGRHSSEREVRAMMAARAARLTIGTSGISVAGMDALVSMLNCGLHPVVPMIGSLGEADLIPLAHIASAMMGYGFIEYEGAVLPAAEALRRAGVQPLAPKGKDGLSLVSSNAGSVGLGALACLEAARGVEALIAAASLSFEGYRANLSPLQPETIELRPVPGQEAVAAAMMRALAGGELFEPLGSRKLQDPLSFRCVAAVLGACAAAVDHAANIVELELNSSDDNPAILAAHGIALPNANFDATHLALAFETLGLALSRAAAACGERIMKLMSPSFSGLPRFLTRIQDGRTGFATVQKTVAAVVASIQHSAMPMPSTVMPVADRVEDYATMAPGAVEHVASISAQLQALAAIELMCAAQACDLRGDIRLGDGAKAIYSKVRALVSPLEEDRQPSPDIEALCQMIADGGLRGTCSVFNGIPC